MRGSGSLLSALIAACLAGCQSTADNGPTGDSGPPQALPSNHRQQVVTAIKTTFKDPYSLRDATISGPIQSQTSLSRLPAVAVCVMANGKNSYGGYTGMQATAFLFRDGQVLMDNSPYAPDVCRYATYGPFPEIAQLKPR